MVAVNEFADKWDETFARAEMRWMSVEEAEITVRARDLALLGRQCKAIKEGLERIQAVVAEQAEEEGLWGTEPSGPQPITEAYLQQELRRLHAVIEEVVE